MVKVVVIDDDKIVQRSLSNRVEWECVGLGVKEADLATLEKTLPDILLINVSAKDQAPGVRLINQIRQSKVLGSLPLVAVGKDSVRGDLETSLLNNCDIDEFFPKPLLPQVVCAKISNLLALKNSVGLCATLHRGKESVSSRKLNVLLIEDNADDAALLFEALKDEFSVRVKKHWRDCQQYLLDDTTQLPDIIVLDIWFGEKEEGFDAIRWIKSESSLINLPIVVLSAAFSGDDIAKGLMLGASDYIVKPIRPRMVKDRLWMSCIRSMKRAKN